LLLQLNEICVFYEESRICHNVNLKVDYGEEVCLLWRNGVGKTTLLRSIMGLLPIKTGTIIFDDVYITNMKSYEVAKLGIGYVPQGRMLFPNLTVLENLRLGTTAQKGKRRAIPEFVFEYFPLLKERLKQRAEFLSCGEQQMLAIGRALSSLHKLMLLDEPSEGLSAGVVQELIKILKELSQEGDLAILLIEQNLDMALEIATRGYILEKGQIVAEGRAEELHDDEIVRSHLAI